MDKILKKLHELCHLIEPLYQPIVEPISYDATWIIVIWAPGGHGRPYKVPKDVLARDKSNKRFYIRKFSGTVIASPDEERELFYVSTSIPFDDRPNLAAEVSDLSRPLLRDHLRIVGSSLYAQSEEMETIEIARSMQLLDGPPEDQHPRNVGILMFSNRISSYFRYARIEIVDLPDPTGEGMTEWVFEGPIQKQLTDALALIGNYFIRKKTFKREGTPVANVVSNYPYAAVEEVLSNAVYHRSYQIAEPITVRFTPEAMEVTSFPGFDRSITQEKIERFELRSSMYRNRRIGDFLKELGLSEGRNTGFPKALAALDQNDSPRPTFEMDENRGYLTVRIGVNPAFLPEPPTMDQSEMEYHRRIEEALAGGPLSLSELSRALGYKAISKKLTRTIDRMITEGIIARVSVGTARSKLALIAR